MDLWLKMPPEDMAVRRRAENSRGLYAIALGFSAGSAAGNGCFIMMGDSVMLGLPI